MSAFRRFLRLHSARPLDSRTPARGHRRVPQGLRDLRVPQGFQRAQQLLHPRPLRRSTSMPPRTGCIAMRRTPRAASPRRRRCMEIFTSIAKLLAPILAYTADEAWEHAAVHHRQRARTGFPGSQSRLRARRGEQAGRAACSRSNTPSRPPSKRSVQAKDFTRNNEADVSLTVPESDAALLPLAQRPRLRHRVLHHRRPHGAPKAPCSTATARKTEHCLCPRCRKHEPVLESGLCERCDEVVG